MSRDREHPSPSSPVAVVHDAAERSSGCASVCFHARFSTVSAGPAEDLPPPTRSHGVADLVQERARIVTELTIVDEDEVAHEHRSTAFVDGDVLIQQMPTDDPGRDTWVRMADSAVGLAGTPVGMLWWLAGVIEAHAVDGDVYRVTIDPRDAIANAPARRGRQLHRAFEDAQSGLLEGGGTIRGTVTLDAAGRVATQEVVLPAGEAGLLPGPVPPRGWRVCFGGYDEPVDVRLPEGTVDASVQDLLDLVGDPGDEVP